MAYIFSFVLPEGIAGKVFSTMLLSSFGDDKIPRELTFVTDTIYILTLKDILQYETFDH